MVNSKERKMEQINDKNLTQFLFVPSGPNFSNFKEFKMNHQQQLKLKEAVDYNTRRIGEILELHNNLADHTRQVLLRIKKESEETKESQTKKEQELKEQIEQLQSRLAELEEKTLDGSKQSNQTKLPIDWDSLKSGLPLVITLPEGMHKEAARSQLHHGSVRRGFRVKTILAEEDKLVAIKSDLLKNKDEK